MMRNLCDLGAGSRRRSGAGNKRILIRIPSRDAPSARDATVQSKFVSISALAAGLQNSCRIVRIGGSRAGAILEVNRGRQREIATDIPLGSYLVVTEFLGGDLLCDAG